MLTSTDCQEVYISPSFSQLVGNAFPNPCWTTPKPLYEIKPRRNKKGVATTPRPKPNTIE